jgi:hypothetical protein
LLIGNFGIPCRGRVECWLHVRYVGAGVVGDVVLGRREGRRRVVVGMLLVVVEVAVASWCVGWLGCGAIFRITSFGCLSTLKGDVSSLL